MTDDEAEALLHPPRRWPPPTAVAAAGLMLLPPAAGVGFALFRGGWVGLVVPLVWMYLAVGAAYQLVRGHPTAFGGAVRVLLVAGVVAAGTAAAPGGVGPMTSRFVGVMACWLLMVAGLVWWPETQRWCGRLPPLDPEDPS